MKKLQRSEMKKLKGGERQATWGYCSATATCANGSTITLDCQGFGITCTGVDYGTTYPGTTAPPEPVGVAYCQNSSGTYTGISCPAT